MRFAWAAICLSTAIKSIEKFLSDLLDLLVFLCRGHQGIFLLRQQRPLSLDNLSDLVLLFSTKTDLALVEQRAEELTALDLLSKLALANVEKFIALLTNHGMVLSVLTQLTLDLFGAVYLLSRFLFNHTVHGNVHRFWSV